MSTVKSLNQSIINISQDETQQLLHVDTHSLFNVNLSHLLCLKEFT